MLLSGFLERRGLLSGLSGAFASGSPPSVEGCNEIQKLDLDFESSSALLACIELADDIHRC